AERKDGSTYEINVMEFVGNPLCSGVEDTLEEKGTDPANCSVCALVEQFPKRFSAPRRRYVAHVMRYRTKAGTFDITSPFAVEVLVWSFTDKKFNTIVDIAEEHGDLRKKDLLFGPCTNENF